MNSLKSIVHRASSVINKTKGNVIENTKVVTSSGSSSSSTAGASTFSPAQTIANSIPEKPSLTKTQTSYHYPYDKIRIVRKTLDHTNNNFLELKSEMQKLIPENTGIKLMMLEESRSKKSNSLSLFIYPKGQAYKKTIIESFDQWMSPLDLELQRREMKLEIHGVPGVNTDPEGALSNVKRDCEVQGISVQDIQWKKPVEELKQRNKTSSSVLVSLKDSETFHRLNRTKRLIVCDKLLDVSTHWSWMVQK